MTLIIGARIGLEETDTVCVHCLSSLSHYVVALDEDVDLRAPYELFYHDAVLVEGDNAPFDVDSCVPMAVEEFAVILTTLWKEDSQVYGL